MREFMSNAAVRPTAYIGRKLFTVASANRSLVLVRRIVGDIVRNYDQLLDLQDMLELSEREPSRDSLHLQDESASLADQLRDCLEELEMIGVEITDFSLGIVDFPSTEAGRSICLCWQYGEDGVDFWREIGDGFEARQPVESLGRYRAVAGRA